MCLPKYKKNAYLIFSSILMLLTSFTVLSEEPVHKVALVIGNSQYDRLALRTPANDAKDIADTLRRYDFEVIYKLDSDLEGMNQAVDEFEAAMKPNSVALFYYAGHGVQIKGENYLMPLGSINSETERQIIRNTQNVNDILDRMKPSNALNVVILDACRDNPLKSSTRSSTTRGLKRISDNDLPASSLIMYSTSANDTADDGSGRNSPFAKALLETMNNSHLTLLDVMRKTGSKVGEYTRGKQTPEVMLKGSFDFWLHGKPSSISGSSVSKADSRWLEISTSKDVLVFEEYIANFPDSRFVPDAKSKIKRFLAENAAALKPDLSSGDTVFKFSEISEGEIQYGGVTYPLTESLPIPVNKGNNLFTLLINEQKIYGNIQVLYVDFENPISYGYDIPLPKPNHVDRVKKGAPVRYTVTTRTSSGGRIPGMRYTLSLLPIRFKN